MSSIRRSSLNSITLGLLTVIGANFRSLSLKRRHSRQRFAEIETNFRERAGAVRPVVMRWRLGLARFGSYFYRTSSMPASGLERCDGRHRLPFEYPIIFWMPCAPILFFRQRAEA